MKILMLCEFYNENLEYQENLLTKYYLKHGHEVTVVTSTFQSVFDYYNDKHDKSAPPRTFFDGGAKIIMLRYRYNILNRLRAFTSIAGILEEERPDLIYVHDIMPNLPEAIRYKKAHPECRMIMDYHADYSNSGKNWVSRNILHGILRKWFLDRARPHLSRIFAYTPAAIPFLHDMYGIPVEDIELLPLGADLDLCAQVKAREEGAILRRELGIANNAIVIVAGGKLEPWKKTELLIEAVKALPSLPLELVIIGESPPEYADYKASLLKVANAAPNIHFTGWLEAKEIYKYLDLADMAVFPAGQSILWQQAIAMGLPLVVGDVGSQDISYLNLYDNIVILPKDRIRTDCLIEEISRIVSSPGCLEAMGEGARIVADEQLDWNKLIQRTLRFQPSAASRAICGHALPPGID
jgi:glycosyltransferase involved in cell wall biosynthesis